MTISDNISFNNIQKYAKLLKEQYELREKLDFINDDLINLTIYMSDEEIKEANKLFEKIMNEE